MQTIFSTLTSSFLPKINISWVSSFLLIFAWTSAYYITSIVSTLWNKQLVDNGISVSILTMVQLVVSLAADIAVMHYGSSEVTKTTRHTSSEMKNRKLDENINNGATAQQLVVSENEASVLSVQKVEVGDDERSTTSSMIIFSAFSSAQRFTSAPLEIFFAFAPISIFVILSKLTTYLSYTHVSVALSHSAKASEPIFNVLVAAIVFREFHSSKVYLSLVPIAVGITLASVTDFSYNHIGFFWSVTSALMKVLQNIYTKRLMLTGKFSFWEIHLFCGAASLAIFAPILMIQTFLSSSSSGNSHGLSSVTTSTTVTTTTYGFTNSSSLYFISTLIFALFFSSLLQYGSSVASYKVLHLVSHLSYTVINVAKRLVVILSGVALSAHAGRRMSILNTLGVLLAVFGILAYHLVEDEEAASWPADPFSWQSWITWLRVELFEKKSISFHKKSLDKSENNDIEKSMTDSNVINRFSPQRLRNLDFTSRIGAETPMVLEAVDAFQPTSPRQGSNSSNNSVRPHDSGISGKTIQSTIEKSQGQTISRWPITPTTVPVYASGGDGWLSGGFRNRALLSASIQDTKKNTETMDWGSIPNPSHITDKIIQTNNNTWNISDIPRPLNLFQDETISTRIENLMKNEFTSSNIQGSNVSNGNYNHSINTTDIENTVNGSSALPSANTAMRSRTGAARINDADVVLDEFVSLDSKDQNTNTGTKGHDE